MTSDREGQQLTQVEIYGQSYGLRGDGDPAYVHELAAFVIDPDAVQIGLERDGRSQRLVADIPLRDVSRHRAG